jgi:hypothetical protein
LGGWVARTALIMVPAVWALAAGGQTSRNAASGNRALGVASANAAAVVQNVYREIDDPYSGEHWLLLRDANHPGGPGRLMLTVQKSSTRQESGKDGARPVKRMPVIRAGDALIVEEHTAVLDARLKAVALSAACQGETLTAHLAIGEKVVRVVAEGPGLATFDSESMVRR